MKVPGFGEVIGFYSVHDGRWEVGCERRSGAWDMQLI